MDEVSRIVRDKGALLVMCVHPLTLGLLKPPGSYDADIAVGEGQPLGMAQNYGGPLLGLFTAKKEYIRRMPGRIIAETVDTQGNRGFVMTLQTREQHIRREKATSNICTNEGLCALMAAVYLSLLGRKGIKEVAELMYAKAHYLAGEIEKLDGLGLMYPESPFFNEFVVKTERNPAELLSQLEQRGFFGGFELKRMDNTWEHQILIAVTEKRTKAEMDGFISALGDLSQ
jgi:glycine dehydrogenase subunit 1